MRSSTPVVSPRGMPLREFLRGGYQRISEPTVIYGAKGVQVGTWVPGGITTRFGWQASSELPRWLREEGKGR